MIESDNGLTSVRVQAPTASRSGYGERSREILEMVQARARRVVHRPYAWNGRTITDPPSPTEDQDVDVHVFVGIPEDMQAREGAFNVLVTAGTEVDRVSPQAIAGANDADLVVVPSAYAKRVMTGTAYQYKGVSHRVHTPVRVVPECPSWGACDSALSSEIDAELGGKPAFMCVAQWLDTRPSVGRKGVSQVVEVFRTLHHTLDAPPVLVLKTDVGTLSRSDRARCERAVDRLSGDADVILVQGDLTEAEMHSLYTAEWARGFVSLSKGEGFGRPVLEAGLHGLPVVCPGHTGMLDHTDDALQVLVGAEAVDVPTDLVAYTDSYPPGSRWMYPDTRFAVQAVAAVHSNQRKYQERAEEHMHVLRDTFAFDAVSETLIRAIQDVRSQR